MLEDEPKKPLTTAILIMLEKACRLKVVTGFEKRFLIDRCDAVERFSMKAVFSRKQIEVIEEMAARHDEVIGGE